MKSSPSSSTPKPFKRTKHPHHHDREDRISQMPEPILHAILSLLPPKDAIKTSVLSKTWNSLWNSSPDFDFDQNDFNQSVTEFCKYVDDSIKRRRTQVSIKRFNLAVYFNNIGLKSRWEDLERWMNYAVSNQVRNLVLHYYNRTKSKKAWPYPLPTSSAIFRAKSLTELDLFGCRFVESSIQFQFSLKKLKLTHVDIDDRTLQSLVSNCGSLEELTIEQCRGFQWVNLSSDKLERVDLYLNRFQVQKVAIEAPNLQFLSYTGDYGNVMGSLEASKFNTNLRELKFCKGVTITDAMISRVIRDFPFLRKLELIWCSLAGNIRLSYYGMGDRTIKNGELVANLLDCYTEMNRRDIRPGLYKLQV